jgi:NAD(P)-dependent dehydrogenase (short-subunit alcohol dehydrogenase family)
MLVECLLKRAMSNQLFIINGKKTLITGATGAFGFDIASEFKKHGQNVTGLGRSDQGLGKLQSIGANAIKLDMNDENAIKDFCKNCEPFDNIILSHGIPGSRPMRMLSHEFALNIIQTNLISTLDLLSNLLRARKINSPGRIVFFSSIAARMGANNNIAYAASKLGGEAAMNGLARDLLKKEITVNSIAPAGIETPIYAGTKPAVLDASNYPLGLGLIEDTTNAAMFLCLNGSKYITGETIIMDGGSLWID